MKTIALSRKVRLTPEISRIIKKLYPKDKAVGHVEGDIRGAVSIMIPMDEKD